MCSVPKVHSSDCNVAAQDYAHAMLSAYTGIETFDSMEYADRLSTDTTLTTAQYVLNVITGRFKIVQSPYIFQ